MNKKIISLVLALVMVLGTFTSVFAESTKEAKAKEEVKKTETKKAEAGEKVEKVVGKDNKIQYVIDKKLVEGYEDGTYGLDKNIKRSEITRLLVLANGNEELSKQLQGSMKIYSDVDAKHWANGVISVGTTVPSDANGIAMLAGYPDGSFKPENDVTYAELAKMLVVLAKKDLTADMVKNAKWATDWMTWAAQLGILNDVNVVDSNKAANRADAFTMIYNALYAMESFKRVPANETRGIISSLSSEKLVLNQDSKKEYKVNNNTVILTGDNTRKQFVYVSSLNNFHAQLGSFVRILTNDKNEVTHIIELGNPEYLANGNAAGVVKGNNNVWKGVADNTVETANYAFNTNASLSEIAQKDINRGYAKVVLSKNTTKADMIKFFNANDKEIVGLNINKDTKVYVANPYNNIMREVRDINEALSLIGFRTYADYKIPNVYAGFDSTDFKAAIKGYETGKHTAKAIVFNIVTKDNGGEKYRILESTDTHFNSLVENAAGEKMNINDVFNKVHFALEYGEKYNVVERRGDAVTTLIDHEDYKNYPMVRVSDINSNDTIIVEDRFGATAPLYLGDADIFNAKQYKDLKVGDYLQFNTSGRNFKVSEVSLFTTALEKEHAEKMFNDKRTATVLNIVDGVEAKTATGTILDISKAGDFYNVEINIIDTTWREGLANTTHQFKVNANNAAKILEGKTYTFKIDDTKYVNTPIAYAFKEAVKEQPRVKTLAEQLTDAKAKLATQIVAVDKAEGKTLNVNPVNQFTTVEVPNADKAMATKQAIVDFKAEVAKLEEIEKEITTLENKTNANPKTDFTTTNVKSAAAYSVRVANRTTAFNKLVKDNANLFAGVDEIK